MRALSFTIDGTCYAVALERLVEIVPRVMMSRLPGADDFVEGVFTYRGELCIAVSLRRRFGHPPRRPRLEDHVVVVRGRRRLLGLVVDRVEGDRALEDERVVAPPVQARYVRGVVALESGVIVVHDLDALLSESEEEALDAAAAAHRRP